MESHSARKKYRPEIDGLRAIAVAGVVLFHTGLGLPGGYVGVDVFFVISGYLITSIVARELDAGDFSLSQFWARRIRRILPAAMLVVAVVSVASFCLLIPSDFEQVMRSAFWQAAMVSNHFFQQDVGYFAEQAETKPLLHTWSLAVEEQFYLFFPPMLLLYRRFCSRKLLMPILILAGVSLAISVWQTPRDEASAFFLLPSRAWELLAGSALALISLRSIRRGSAETLSWMGMTLIFASMLLYTPQTLFPGWAAAVPVGGTVAVILGCTNQKTLAGRLLAWRPCVALGRISYSVYLWHWPLVAFANLILLQVGMAARIGLAVGSVLLAIPSYYLVEQPFRRSTFLSSPRRAYAFAAATLVPVVAISAFVLKADGFPQRTDQTTLLLSEDVVWTGREYASVEGRPISLGIAAARGEAPDFVLWGDSHARVAAFVFDEVARTYNLRGEAYATSNAVPIPGVGMREPELPSGTPAELTAYNRAIKEQIVSSGTDTVILVSRWAAWCSGRTAHESLSGESRFDFLAAETTGEPADPEHSADLLRTHLGRLLSELTQEGITVWIFSQVPECGSIDPARDFLKANRFPRLNSLTGRRPESDSIDAHAKRQALAHRVLSISDNFAAVHLIDPAPAFFDRSGVLQVYSERSHYRDDDHLTRYGATHLLGPYVEQILSKVAASNRKDDDYLNPRHVQLAR